MGVQVLRTGGSDELVVLSRRDYDALRARAGDDGAEDAMADVLAAEAAIVREARGGSMLPAWLSAEILAGAHPIRAAREHAKVGLADLAMRVGLSERRLSDAEEGGEPLDGDALGAVATALGVEPDWLRD